MRKQEKMKNAKVTRRFFFGLMFVAVLLGGALFAQMLVQVEGRITDEQGVVLPGAQVTIKNVDTGNTYSGVSRPDGRFIISGILAGTYDLTAEMSGFAAEIRKGMALKVGGRFTVDFKLSMKRIEETVEVTALSPVVEVTKSEVSSVVERKQIDDLPLLGRNFADLALLKPGVTPRPGSNEEPVTANAQPRGSGDFLIDGVSNKGNGVGMIRANIPPDAIQEFRVLTNQFTSEFGDSSGLVLNVITRSGTNQYRGRVYGFYRNQAFDSLNYFANHESYQGPKISNPQRPEFKDYRLGGFFGGPIIKDKLHFFVAYEHPYHSAYDVFNSPLFPKENVPWSRYNNQFLAKLNYQLNEKNLFSLRFSHDKPFETGVGTGGIVSPDMAITDYYQDDSFEGTWTSFPSDNTLNELRLQYSRNDVKIDTKYPDAYSIYRPSLMSGKYENQPQQIVETRYQIVDNFSLFLDKHQLKFGIDFSYIPEKGVLYQDNPGAVVFNTDAPFNAADPNTYPFLFVYSAGDPHLSNPTTNAGVYVQDSWRVLPTLTLNLGVRYSYYHMKGLDLSNKENIDPRVGFSWDPIGDGKTVIRGGFGKFTNNILSNEGLMTSWLNQLDMRQILFPGWPDPHQPNPFGMTMVIPGSTSYIPQPGQIPPSTIQVTVGFQRQFMTDLAASVDLVYAKGKHLLRWMNLNSYIQYQRPDPTKGDIMQIQGSGKSDYKALLVSISKRYSHGWGLEVSYTLGNGKNDTMIEYRTPANYENIALEYGPDDNDARHRLSMNGMIDLPLGFQFSAWAYYMSALPYTITTGNDDYHNYSYYAYPAGKSRNSGRGADYFALNARISKFININPVSLQLFAELFNATNKANFSSFQGNMQAANFGKPTLASDPRLIQIGVRFNF